MLKNEESIYKFDMNIRDINVRNTSGLIVFSSFGKYIFDSFFSSIIAKIFFSFLFQLTRHCLFLARIQYCPASGRHKVNLGCRGAAQDIPSLTTEVWSFLV